MTASCSKSGIEQLAQVVQNFCSLNAYPVGVRRIAVVCRYPDRAFRVGRYSNSFIGLQSLPGSESAQKLRMEIAEFILSKTVT